MVFDARVTGARRSAATLILLAGIVAGCDRPDAPSEPTPEPVAAPSPSPTLDRAALLSAVAAAASDASAGVARARPDPLAGRTFSLRMAFGCFGAEPAAAADGPAAADGAPRWTSSPDGRTIRLTLSPADWSEGDVSGPPPAGFETLSGIWINQPWMRSEACPAWSIAAPDVPVGVAPTREVGLIMVRPTGGSRIGRSGDRAFTHVVRGEGDEPARPPTRGYRLVVEGRLTGWADGGVVRCRVVTPDRPPSCVIGAVVDRIAFEDGAGGSVLSEWRPG